MIYTVESATIVLQRLTFAMQRLHGMFTDIISEKFTPEHEREAMDMNKLRNCEQYTHIQCMTHLELSITLIKNYISRTYRDENYTRVMLFINKHILLFKEIFITISRIYTGAPEIKTRQEITDINAENILCMLWYTISTIIRQQLLTIHYKDTEQLMDEMENEEEFPCLPSSSTTPKSPQYASVWHYKSTRDMMPVYMKPSTQLGVIQPIIDTEEFPSLSSIK
jgi:hypothetical protein